MVKTYVFLRDTRSPVLVCRPSTRINWLLVQGNSLRIGAIRAGKDVGDVRSQNELESPNKNMFVVDIFCSFVKVRFVRATTGCAFPSLSEVIMHGYR